MLHKQRKVSCAVVGDGMVGKTSLIRAFLGGKYSDKYVATSTDVFSGSTIYDGEKYALEISDLAGERDSDVLKAPGIKECDVIIVCYNIQDQESFDGIRAFWIPELQKQKKRAKIILVGLQSDSGDNSDGVLFEEGEELKDEIQADGFFECSAKKNHNISTVFRTVVDVTVKSRKTKLSFIRRALGR